MIRGRRGFYALLAGTLLACAGAGEAGNSGRKTDLRTLESADNRDVLAAAAIRVAASGDAAALGRLGRLVAEPAFLARLDDTTNPQLAYSNLNLVFAALAKNPSTATESLCLRLAATPAFDVNSDRSGLVLEALAAVRPMSAAGAELFSRTNADGYYGRNGQLLAANGSARAIGLLEAMFADRSRTVADRIDMSREALVPYRTSLHSVRLVDSLTRRPDLEPELARGLAECLFEYRPDEWYGKRRRPPQAPSWSAAAPQARREAAALGLRLLETRRDWPATLRAGIESVIRSAPVPDTPDIPGRSP
ncbi:MAG: hypothetical protein JWP91_4156 [Fibrobacteres bacterium]|nr:hypothetical protein [Fibrobacterota bacterium]